MRIALGYMLCSGLLLFVLDLLSARPALSGDYRAWILIGGSAALLYRIARFRKKAPTVQVTGPGILKDSRTGLPDLHTFGERLDQALTEAREKSGELEVMYLDCDRFRTIVRTLGHGAGESVLQQVAERLSGSLDPTQTLAHVGSDEFVLLVPDIEQPENAKGLASRLLAALRAPFRYEGHVLHLSASIGISLFPHDGDSGEILTRNAYAAMNRAKELGGDLYQFYFSDSSAYSVRSLTIENRLHQALEREEFLLLYQPQLHLARDRIDSVEALVSWKHPEHPGLSAEEFIPLAEESSLIESMGEWILLTACNENRRWQEEGMTPLRVEVNVSGRQFQRGNLVEVVKHTLESSGLDPRWLALEITETVLIRNVEETIRTLQGLRELGVRVTADDFGTGYSSLSYLRQFPIEALKIDRSFVAGLPRYEGADAIVSAVIAMGHALGLEVVAEGVESEEQRAFLAEKKCDLIQGFLVSRPLKAADLVAFLGHSLPQTPHSSRLTPS